MLEEFSYFLYEKSHSPWLTNILITVNIGSAMLALKFKLNSEGSSGMSIAAYASYDV